MFVFALTTILFVEKEQQTKFMVFVNSKMLQNVAFKSSYLLVIYFDSLEFNNKDISFWHKLQPFGKQNLLFFFSENVKTCY